MYIDRCIVDMRTHIRCGAARRRAERVSRPAIAINSRADVSARRRAIGPPGIIK